MSWSDRKRAENMTTTSFFKRQRTISRGVWGDMSSRRALGYLARSLVEVLEDDEQREAQHQMNQQLMMQMLAAAQGHAGCGAGAATISRWLDHDHAAGPCCACRGPAAGGNGNASPWSCPATYALPFWTSTSWPCSSSDAIPMSPTSSSCSATHGFPA